MVVAICIISIVVVFLGIMLWSIIEVFGDVTHDLQDLINDYTELTTKEFKRLENEIKNLKEQIYVGTGIN